MARRPMHLRWIYVKDHAALFAALAALLVVAMVGAIFLVSDPARGLLLGVFPTMFGATIWGLSSRAGYPNRTPETLAHERSISIDEETLEQGEGWDPFDGQRLAVEPPTEVDQSALTSGDPFSSAGPERPGTPPTGARSGQRLSSRTKVADQPKAKNSTAGKKPITRAALAPPKPNAPAGSDQPQSSAPSVRRAPATTRGTIARPAEDHSTPAASAQKTNAPVEAKAAIRQTSQSDAPAPTTPAAQDQLDPQSHKTRRRQQHQAKQKRPSQSTDRDAQAKTQAKALPPPKAPSPTPEPSAPATQDPPEESKAPKGGRSRKTRIDQREVKPQSPPLDEASASSSDPPAPPSERAREAAAEKPPAKQPGPSPDPKAQASPPDGREPLPPAEAAKRTAAARKRSSKKHRGDPDAAA